MIKDFTSLLVKNDLPHLQININRPDKRNALNKTVIRELNELLDWATAQDSLKTLTISGEGSAFCSGADLDYLKELKGYDTERNRMDTIQLAKLYQKLYMFPKPVIAAVNGPAVAGGCGLATVCDIVLASENAVLGYPEVRIGFVAAIVSLFLIRQIGERKARELLLTGKLLNAREAEKYGLVNKVVSSEALYNEVGEWQTLFSNNAPQALRATKNLFQVFRFEQIEQLIETYTEINIAVRQTPEFFEGISSFLEKRKPNWQQ
jgi:methylglutaconyl-CoA hydratase